MYEKFKDLKDKTPKESAEIVGKVAKDNYLAHSIRHIELAIMKTQGIRYHIFTYPSYFDASKIFFSERYLKKTLSALVKSKQPEIYDDIVRSLDIHVI